MAPKLILVTGVNGFIGAHIAEQLLERGYRVRGTARGEKYDTLVETVNKPGLDFVKISDVAEADFTEALNGVDAIIHTACPLAGRKNLDETFKTSIEGTMNLVRQANKAGVRKIVATSSFGALLSPSFAKVFSGDNITESDWSEVTDEEFEKNKENPYYIYFTAKSRTEKALLEFGKQHPEFDIVSILPGYVLGPYARTFPFPTAVPAFGTNEDVYQLISKGPIAFAPNWFVDVRDVAKAHIVALEATNLPADKKRFIINAGTRTWKQIAEHLKSVKPEVKDRIISLDEATPLPGPSSDLDSTRARELLGVADYIPLEKTLDDTVNDLLMLEKAWDKN
ncbi:hypothetical protein GALMADRAFT_1123520 [Galerina marginata CBS 339.88]|uniref:NAD-dependent epimerase/dehydratase domain-containing protein n=1 Tax=Galerina marginata (strain CBS 339.88) TaxID=685588 RepID=A0A067TFP5_GALM3|nr:hypothetical protein GALMADRAFT_1123520 [Galerina marginata CBS 339.88]